jgi:hypothetical protein
MSFGFNPRSCATVNGAVHRDGNDAVTGPLHRLSAGTAGETGGAMTAVCGPSAGFTGTAAALGSASDLAAGTSA